jgi:Ran-binding protein 1
MADFAKLMAESAKKDNEEVLASAGEGEGKGEDEGELVEQEESTQTFEAKVKLEEVDTVTGEEDEEAVYSQRSKLYVYGEALLDKGTGTKAWLERGKGDMKLLQHKDSGRIRVLMRQEDTKKIIANFALDPRIELTPNAGAADKSWVWVAYDFDGTELVETMFALKFGTPELAKTFQETFVAKQAEMQKLLAGEDAAEGAEEADEAADALACATLSGDAAAEEAAEEAAAEAPAAEESAKE